MAKSETGGKGRSGAVRYRTQTRNPKTGLWTKRSAVSGRFMDVKQAGGTLKGVRREN